MWKHCEQFTPTWSELAHVAIRCNPGDSCTASVGHFVKRHGLFSHICLLPSVPPLPSPCPLYQLPLCQVAPSQPFAQAAERTARWGKLDCWTSVCPAEINCCSGCRCRGLISCSAHQCHHLPFRRGRREWKSVINSVVFSMSTGISLHSWCYLLNCLFIIHLGGLGKKIFNWNEIQSELKRLK